MISHDRIVQAVQDCTTDPSKKEELAARIASLCRDERLSEDDRIALSVFIAASESNRTISTSLTQLFQTGMLVASVAAMQGILAAGDFGPSELLGNGAHFEYGYDDAQNTAKVAVMYADALLARLLEGSGTAKEENS